MPEEIKDMDMTDMLAVLRKAGLILRHVVDDVRLADAVDDAATRWDHEVMDRWDATDGP